MNEKQQLIEAGRYLIEAKLAWGTSGNISARMDDERMAITASGTYMGNLKPDDIAECQIYAGRKKGTRKLSKETPMHRGIYQKRKDAKAILHSSPFYTTLLSCTHLTIFSDLFVEAMYYLEDIEYIDYHHPGSQELAQAVTEKADKANVIILRNHGVVVFEDSVSEAMMRLETLELTCRMILKAKESGVRFCRIPQETVNHFLEKSLYKPRKKINRHSGNLGSGVDQ